MNFDIDISILRERLKTVGSFTPRKSPMPILDNVKMDVGDGVLKLSCTNLEIYMITTISVIHDEAFSFTVNAQDLSSFVSNLTGNAAISFDGRRMILKCGGAKAGFPTIDAKEFPTIPTEGLKKFTLPSVDLQKAFDLVAFASLTGEENRPTLECFNVMVSPNLMTVACTDGFRVAETKTDIVFSDSENFLLPVSHLSAIKKLSGDIVVGIGGNTTSFKSSDTSIYAINMSGIFPQYLAIVPPAFKNTVVIELVGWMKAILRRCLSFEPMVVVMVIDSEGIDFTVETEQKGKYQEKLPISIALFEKDFDYQLILNPAMLVELVTTSEAVGKELTMRWNQSFTPVMFTVSGYDKWFAIQMPMRLS